MWSWLRKFWNAVDVNCDPLSETRICGNPKRAIISLKRLMVIVQVKTLDNTLSFAVMLAIFRAVTGKVTQLVA